MLRGSIVSYASEVKFDLLDVPTGPVVSEQAALQMAEGARRVLGADVGLALTGVAGPTEQDGMPVGTLCVGIVDGRTVELDPHVAPARPARADAPVQRDHVARPAAPHDRRSTIGRERVARLPAAPVAQLDRATAF